MVSVVSLVVGAFLIAVGVITRQERAVSAGKRRFHGFAFERRWIGDAAERERHAGTVASRLDLDVGPHGEMTISQAAERLGVSVSTVRRRVRRGELDGVHRDGRLTGVILRDA